MNTRLNSVVGLSVALWLAGVTGFSGVAADAVVVPSPVGQMVHNMNPANWTMPQWKMPNFRSILPGQEEKTRVVKKEDGLLSETKAVATNSWNKTKEVMDPQKLNPARLFRSASSTTPSKSSEPEQPGFFSRLFTPAPEESKPKSPNEFLKGDRPGF